MTIKALLIAVSPLLCEGLVIPEGSTFAEMTFPNQQSADFFKAKLNWAKIRVEFGAAVNPRRDLSMLEHIPQAEKHAAALDALGILSLGDLASFNAKALQKAIGAADAGPLIRAAKRVIAGGSAVERVVKAPVEPIDVDGDVGDDQPVDDQSAANDDGDKPKAPKGPKAPKPPKSGKK